MPQMAPLSWLILFILFSLSFIMFNVLNYFCSIKNKTIKNINYNKSIQKTLFNWKW